MALHLDEMGSGFSLLGAYWHAHDLCFEIPFQDCIGRDGILALVVIHIAKAFNGQEYSCDSQLLMKHKWRYYFMGMMLLHVEELHVQGSSLLEWLECFNRRIEHVRIIFAAQRGSYVL